MEHYFGSVQMVCVRVYRCNYIHITIYPVILVVKNWIDYSELYQLIMAQCRMLCKIKPFLPLKVETGGAMFFK